MSVPVHTPVSVFSIIVLLKGFLTGEKLTNMYIITEKIYYFNSFDYFNFL